MMGQTISHYRILEKLGEDETGVVFKAEDISSHRQVALRLLAKDLDKDVQALRKFRREVRVLSSLGHRHVSAIYRAGRHRGQSFLATQLLEGETLKERMEARPVECGELIEIAIQIADGLDAAHRSGIIHRDLKPSSFLITREGEVKIVDFALGSLLPIPRPPAVTDPALREALAALAEAKRLLTNPSGRARQVAYLSPEQVRGEQLDERSDLFSFGAVLYEMATGKKAFDGTSAAAIFDAILDRIPARPGEVKPGVPRDLEEIIVKALERDRGRRYQHASELCADLKRLRAGTDLSAAGAENPPQLVESPPAEEIAEAAISPALLDQTPALPAEGKPGVPQRHEEVIVEGLEKDRKVPDEPASELCADLNHLVGQADLGAAKVESTALRVEGPAVEGISEEVQRAKEEGNPEESAPNSAGAAPESIRFGWQNRWALLERHRRFLVPAVTATVILLASLGYWFHHLGQEGWGVSNPPIAHITRITSTNDIHRASVSPHGDYVGYVRADNGMQSLWVRSLKTGTDTELVPAAGAVYLGLAFSPEGHSLYYVQQLGGHPGELFRIPVWGGEPDDVVTNVMSSVGVSPDGKRLAFIRFDPEQQQSSLVVANARDGGEVTLAVQKTHERFAVGPFVGPAWSPNGKTLVVPVENARPSGSARSLLTVDASDGKQNPLGADRWFFVGQPVWLPDGRSLMVTASQLSSPARSEVWKIAYPSGQAQKITDDQDSYVTASLTSVGRELVTVQGEAISNLWTLPQDGALPPRQMTSGVGSWDGATGVTVMPNGQIVYASFRLGNGALWLIDPKKEGEPQQLTRGGGIANDVYPSACGDGRHIVFSSTRGGSFDIWRVDADGTNLKQLTQDGDAFVPFCTADGRWVFYSSVRAGKATPLRIPIGGGRAVRVSDQSLSMLSASPGGQWVSGITYAPGRPAEIEVLPFGGGPPVKAFPYPATANPDAGLQWTVDGRALTFVETENGVSNLWEQPLQGGAAKRLTDFRSNLIFRFAWSREGGLVVARGTNTSNAVMLSEFGEE